MRFTKRLAVMALVGIFLSGSGEIAGGGMPWYAHQDFATKIENIILKSAAFLSPSSAEASITKESSINETSRRPIVVKTKKSKAKRSVASKARTKRIRRVSDLRCEPQSLTYARQRSGIMRSRTGSENGPLTWFASEQKLGKTSKAPDPGSVLILGNNKRHGMPTGHVAFVEKVYPDGPSSYKIIFSHTNYDRKCSLETNIEAVYNSEDMTLDIFSGAWKSWGSGLRVAGFIQD